MHRWRASFTLSKRSSSSPSICDAGRQLRQWVELILGPAVYPRLEGFELREEQAKKGRGAWTYGSKERQEFAEFYAAEASAAASAARQSGSSTAQLYGLTCTVT